VRKGFIEDVLFYCCDSVPLSCSQIQDVLMKSSGRSVWVSRNGDFTGVLYLNRNLVLDLSRSPKNNLINQGVHVLIDMYKLEELAL
jgi:hypothetical protein